MIGNDRQNKTAQSNRERQEVRVGEFWRNVCYDSFKLLILRAVLRDVNPVRLSRGRNDSTISWRN